MSSPDLRQSVYAAAAGNLAAGVVGEISPSLRQIRDSLAILVELLDRHFAESKGPEPYPWTATKALRERLATVYLNSRQTARMTHELARAVSPEPGAAELLEPNQLVEQAVALSRHRFSEDCVVSFDAGQVPAVRSHHGPMVLLLSHLLLVAADNARNAGNGGGVDVSTRRHRSEKGEVVSFEVTNATYQADWNAEIGIAELVLSAVGAEMRVLDDGRFGVSVQIPVPRA